MRRQKSQEMEFSSIQRKRSLRLNHQSSVSSLGRLQIQDNQLAAYTESINGIPTSFDPIPGLQRRSSSRLRKNNIDSAASCQPLSFIRETSVKVQIQNKPDDFGDNPQELQKMLQVYDRQHAFYLEVRSHTGIYFNGLELYNLVDAAFLETYCYQQKQCDREALKAPVTKDVQLSYEVNVVLYQKAADYGYIYYIFQALMMNEMQIVVWSLLLEKFKWFIDASNLTQHYEMELSTQKIEETLYIVAFLAKKISNTEQKTDRIQVSINRSIGKFPNKFKKYLDLKCQLVKQAFNEEFDVTLNLQQINQQWNKLTKPLNAQQDVDVIDYNYEVDNILQISPPYHSENQEEQKNNPNKRNNTKYDGNHIEQFAKPPPPLLQQNQKGKRGRPRKNSQSLLNPRKQKEEQSSDLGSQDLVRDKVKEETDQFFPPSYINKQGYQTRYGRIAKPIVDNEKLYYESIEQRPNRLPPQYKQRYENKRGSLINEKQKKRQKDDQHHQMTPEMINSSEQDYYQYPIYQNQMYYSQSPFTNTSMLSYLPPKFPPPPPHQAFGVLGVPQYSRQDSIFQTQKNEISKITSGNGAFQSVSPHKYDNQGSINFLAGINTCEDLPKKGVFRSGRAGGTTTAQGDFDKDMLPLQMQRNFSSLSNG